MKIFLNQNQINLIQEALLNYSQKNPKKQNILLLTYNSINVQTLENRGVERNFKKIKKFLKST